MDFETGCELMDNGKKIRRSCWEEGLYIYMKLNNGKHTFYNKENKIQGLQIKDFYAYDWEVYEENE